jgi:hypothetical protein
MTCGHCSVESSPAVRGEPSEAELIDWVRGAAAAGVRAIRITGGEPMLRTATVLRLVRECRRLGVATGITTNGYWGHTRSQASRHIRALQRAGLGSLTVSYDRYHADFQGPDPVLHISRAANERALPLRVSLVRGKDEAELAQVVSKLEGARGTFLRVYDLQPVGRARELPLELHRGEVDGFCGACSFPAITDDGRLVACNGPSYFEQPGSPLVLGSLKDTSFAELLERHREDPILDTIRTRGPAGLRDELRQIPGFEAFPFRSRYSGICELCHHVTRSPEAVTALRERLGRPEAAATRLALSQVIDGNRQQGSLSHGYVNGVGACRVFLRAAWEPALGFGRETAHVLGRADIDWKRLADYLRGSGLARPLLAVLDDPGFVRWAPRFFRDQLHARGVSEGMRELVQREALRQIEAALRELGGRGVLLKGAAFLMRAAATSGARATTDVDILVDPALAAPLRERLLARGFEGSADTHLSTFQHLEPVTYQGVPVEIHTRIMPSFMGLPERDMLADARPVPGSDVFDTLGPEGLILHASVHASASFFSFGLKTAWDLLTVLRDEPSIDWGRLAAWANAMRAPRSFWIPIRVLAGEVGLPLPAAFLRRAPVDHRAHRIEMVARHRLFRATEGIFDLDAITKAGLMLLLYDGFAGRVRFVAAMLRWRGSRPRTWRGAVARAQRADVLHQAWRHYKRYRRALAQSAPMMPAAE